MIHTVFVSRTFTTTIYLKAWSEPNYLNHHTTEPFFLFTDTNLLTASPANIEASVGERLEIPF